MSNSPFNRELFDQVMVPNYSPSTMIPVRGKGSRIWDQDGREHIDFAGGIAVTSVGHAHPEMLAALKEQGEKIWHLSNIMTNEPALKLAQQLTDATFAERVFFANSGAEANEAAFKLARRYALENFGPDKHEIIAFHQGFHGRTLFTVSVGGQPKYSAGFGPAIEGITHLPYNDIAALEAAVSEKTCAIVMEPLQGEGGIIAANPAFAQRARELCDQHQALLVMDEIQTGVGRLGTLYAHEQLGITPDIMTSAKGLGNGFPVAAMLTSQAIASHMGVGTHGSTYGGNPLACAIASKVLELVNQPTVLAGVNNKFERLKAGIEAINAKYHFCAEIRGRGLLIGCALTEPYQGQAGVFQVAAAEQGLMVLVAGPDVVRLAPSLLIPEADIDAGLALFEQAVAKVVSG
ncbi:MAG: aspartate aminotransferase family protein [Gammaproteobacteria bacterium]|nr:aspartate aminotransferase family protein [Gammaproteobacteria bacterium]MCP4879420.1 aspartate aminotransferase family protein [Gammaproteobacteria bacterium]